MSSQMGIPSGRIHGLIGLVGGRQRMGQVNVIADHLRHLDLPDTLSQDQLERARRDCEILQRKLSEHPEQFASLVAAAVAQDPELAARAREGLGLTARDFEEEGGGLIILIIIVLVILLWPTDAY